MRQRQSSISVAIILILILNPAQSFTLGDFAKTYLEDLSKDLVKDPRKYINLGIDTYNLAESFIQRLQERSKRSEKMKFNYCDDKNSRCVEIEIHQSNLWFYTAVTLVGAVAFGGLAAATGGISAVLVPVTTGFWGCLGLAAPTAAVAVNTGVIAGAAVAGGTAGAGAGYVFKYIGNDIECKVNDLNNLQDNKVGFRCQKGDTIVNLTLQF